MAVRIGLDDGHELHAAVEQRLEGMGVAPERSQIDLDPRPARLGCCRLRRLGHLRVPLLLDVLREGVGIIAVLLDGVGRKAEDIDDVGRHHAARAVALRCDGSRVAVDLAGERAEQQGYSQVLWLDGVERKYIEEVGAMNVMFKINGEIVTPALTGSILPGITRKSCIEVLRDKGYKVSERLLPIDEIVDNYKKGTLKEAFGTGTAAVISPIGELKYGDLVMKINDGKIGPISQMLYDTLTGIQWGRIPDEFGWTQVVE